MASPRPQEFSLRPKAYTRVLIALACVPLSVVPLLAKPTRMAARNSVRRLTEASPAHTASLQPGGRRPAAKHVPARPGATTRADKRKPAPSATSRANRIAAPRAVIPGRFKAADAATLDSVHAWEQSRPDATSASPTALKTESQPATTSGDSTESVSPAAAEASAFPGTAQSLSPRSVEEDAATPMVLPSPRALLVYDDRGRLVVPAPLYGSHEVLLHQNQMADRDGLTRVQNDAGLLDLLHQKKLVPLPIDETLRVDYRLPLNRRYSRPWTAQFLAALARDHFAAFHVPIQVDSAVRTVQVQRRLMRTNGNAAPAGGETASPHLTGQAIDIAKSSLTLTEIAWMRAYLQPLIEAGKIDVEEEFQQACFHISVYKDYLPATPPHVTMAVTHPSQSPAAY